MQGNWKIGSNDRDVAKVLFDDRSASEQLIIRQCRTAGSNPAPATKSDRMPATYRVYILQNSEGSFYIGLSDDVAHRVEQHNTG